MGLSKRQKAIREADRQAEIRWLEERRKNPPPPPPPPPQYWIDGQLAEMDKMKSILEKLIYGQSHDINLVFEVLRFSYLFQGHSRRMESLKIRAHHYSELQQSSAKDKLWKKPDGIYDLLSGLQIELSILRSGVEEQHGSGGELKPNKAPDNPILKYIFCWLCHIRQVPMQKLHHGIKSIPNLLAEFVCSHQKFDLTLALIWMTYLKSPPVNFTSQLRL
jgi:hypothetical protein